MIQLKSNAIFVLNNHFLNQNSIEFFNGFVQLAIVNISSILCLSKSHTISHRKTSSFEFVLIHREELKFSLAQSTWNNITLYDISPFPHKHTDNNFTLTQFKHTYKHINISAWVFWTSIRYVHWNSWNCPNLVRSITDSIEVSDTWWFWANSILLLATSTLDMCVLYVFVGTYTNFRLRLTRVTDYKVLFFSA